MATGQILCSIISRFLAVVNKGTTSTVTLVGTVTGAAGKYTAAPIIYPSWTAGIRVDLAPLPVVGAIDVMIVGNGAPSADPDPVPSASSEIIDWAAAEVAGLAGKRVRLVSWADRWLESDGVAIWFIVIVNPITRVVLDRHVVQMSPESDPNWFTGAWVIVSQ